jgi:BirA family biotin operon repressor/biotin-[acetyl-CoA-carboxylase] ligase
MQEKLLRSALSELPLSEIHFFDSIDSTNVQGLRMLKEGASEYTLLVAETQTAGRGRLDRKWITTPGTSLAFSLILRPHRVEIQYLPLFSALSGLAVYEAVSECSNARVEIKWPNDILLNGEKTAGILVESAWEGNEIQGLILGIGVNLYPNSIPLDNQFMFPATYLQMHCKRKIKAEDFLKSILEHFIQSRPSLNKPEFISRYQGHLAYLGKPVSLSKPRGVVASGELLGVTPQGALRLRLANGQIEDFAAGDLSLRPN